MDRFQWTCWEFWEKRRKNTLNFGAGPGILSEGGCGALAQMSSPECYSGCTFLPPHLSVAFTRQYFTFTLIIARLSTWSITKFVKLRFYTSAKRVCRAWEIVLGCPRDGIFAVVFSGSFFKLSTKKKSTTHLRKALRCHFSAKKISC